MRGGGHGIGKLVRNSHTPPEADLAMLAARLIFSGKPMPAASTLPFPISKIAAAAPPPDSQDLLSFADVASALGISEADALALAGAGLLRRDEADSCPRRDVEALAERIWRAALPTASDAPGLRLAEAVEATGGGPAIWSAVVAALLEGRLNAFRRRGVFGGPVLAALIVSSAHVVAEVAAEPAFGAPFLWTPTPGR